ncbi:MAG: hypothetical protein PHO92_05615, partial [Candidatus Peribacteraceae bacterium]|nr:hypothetical protein [Candidatus Peribacteraceae bacterium]
LDTFALLSRGTSASRRSFVTASSTKQRKPWIVDVGRQPEQTGAGYHKDRRMKRERNRLHRMIEEELAE